LLEDVGVKQSILADGDIRRRANRLLAAVGGLEPPTADQLLHSAAWASDPSRN
jgi:hypothetical protein